MLFLSQSESREWASCADEAIQSGRSAEAFRDRIRPNLVPAFDFYVGSRLAASGDVARGAEWLREGALGEEEGLFSSTFLLGFLERHGRLAQIAEPFANPAYFIHFAGVPVMKGVRSRFVSQVSSTLPEIDHPLRAIDIGCGDGSLTAAFLSCLVEAGKVPGIDELLLVEPSPAMLETARETVGRAFPGTRIVTENCRIQECSGRIRGHYDLAVSSLAYHHMPIEDKRAHLAMLAPLIDHFVLCEMDANHDTPELYSPELALSVYQSYGRIIDFVFSHDAPVEVATGCVDCFIMAELASILTRPRGVRSDYHMLAGQWDKLLGSALGPGFSRRCASPCYADEHVGLFTMHYGREEAALPGPR
jgi:hypothetical protein